MIFEQVTKDLEPPKEMKEQGLNDFCNSKGLNLILFLTLIFLDCKISLTFSSAYSTGVSLGISINVELLDCLVFFTCHSSSLPTGPPRNCQSGSPFLQLVPQFSQGNLLQI